MPTESGYAPVRGHLGAQIRRRPELNARDVPELVVTEYEPLLDSANARPADWLRIARDIAEHRHSYDGFVVLHGTDTMAYTASALAFLLRGLGQAGRRHRHRRSRSACCAATAARTC